MLRNMWSLLVCLLVFWFCGAQALVSGGDDTTILNELFKPGRYDRRIRPNARRTPLVITVSMYFIDSNDVTAQDSRINSEFYFRQNWKDPRLAFSGLNYPIVGGQELDDLIWKPDTFIPGTTADLKNSKHVFVRIQPDGTILRSVMVESDMECPLDYRYFPYDTQICTLSFESYGMNANDVQYAWQKEGDSVGYNELIAVQDKKIVASKLSSQNIQLSTGNYSRILVQMILKRDPNYYIRNFYGPAVIFTILTWLTFWIPASSLFRGLVLLTSVVCHWRLLSNASDKLPLSQHSTSLDQYLVTCLVFSVLSIIEYFLVTALHKTSNRSSVATGNDLEMNSKEKPAEPGKVESNAGSYLSRSAKYVLSFRQHKRFHSKLDLACKVLFAGVFILYNLYYWVSFPSSQH